MNAPFAPPFALERSYASLPALLHSALAPTPVRAPRLVRLNHELAAFLGLDPDVLESEDGIAFLSGNGKPGWAEPIALAYAGHQFGHFVPQLGDGRAILLGEAIGRDGVRRDLQLKGSGRTPYSRGGDGRAALGPVLREYLVSEAMAALGIPTTRALAAVTTGEAVFRETELPGAVLTRVAASHIRIGTFQYAATRDGGAALRPLADYAIARHYPEAAAAPNRYLAFLQAVVERQARLVAQWLLVGFIHGVMNTDNTAISGETIDYGPCAFLDEYDPATVFSSIDHAGRYAYGNQPRAIQWNLARLAECLLPLLADDPDAAVTIAQEALAGFAPIFDAAYLGGLRAKLGLATEQPGDEALIEGFLGLIAAARADFTLSFRALCDAAAGDDAPLLALLPDHAAREDWTASWQARRALEPPRDTAAAMRRVNPAIIPRNHQIAAALDAAVTRADYANFEALLTALATPYEDRPEHARFAAAPEPNERVLQTFCGT